MSRIPLAKSLERYATFLGELADPETLPDLFIVTNRLELILSRRRSLSYRNHSIDLQSKSMDWCLYDSDLRHERVNKLEKKGFFFENEKISVRYSNFKLA